MGLGNLGDLGKLEPQPTPAACTQRELPATKDEVLSDPEQRCPTRGRVDQVRELEQRHLQ